MLSVTEGPECRKLHLLQIGKVRRVRLGALLVIRPFVRVCVRLKVLWRSGVIL